MKVSIIDRGHWFLDLDGTLVDSSATHGEAFALTLAEHLPDRVAGFDYSQHLGRPTGEILAGLGVADPDQRAALVRCKQMHYRRLVDEGRVMAFPDAEALLDALAATGRAAYVVTSASGVSARAVLTVLGLDRFLSGVVAGDDVARGKPDPACYERAVALFSRDRRQAIAVEDSPAGVAAALGAGLPTIQVRATRHEPGAIPVGSLAEIAAALTAQEAAW